MRLENMQTLAAFVQAYPKTGPYLIASTYKRLLRLGREAHTYAERLCNFGEGSEGEYERKIASITRRARVTLAQCGSLSGVEIEVGGDPRGSCLKVTLPRDSAGALTVRF